MVFLIRTVTSPFTRSEISEIVGGKQTKYSANRKRENQENGIASPISSQAASAEQRGKLQRGREKATGRDRRARDPDEPGPVLPQPGRGAHT